jgi:hypothetical protein
MLQGGANSDHQKGPNQVDETRRNCSEWVRPEVLGAERAVLLPGSRESYVTYESPMQWQLPQLHCAPISTIIRSLRRSVNACSSNGNKALQFPLISDSESCQWHPGLLGPYPAKEISLKNPSKSACQAPRTKKIPITNTISTTSPRKILGIVVMLKRVELKQWKRNPARRSASDATSGSIQFVLNTLASTHLF